MFYNNKIIVGVTLGATLALGFAHKADALTFNLTYDSSLSTFGSQVTDLEKATQYVANQYSSLFSNNVTLNIEVAAGNTSLGESTTYLNGYYNYNQVRTALIANASTPASISATNSLPATNPTGSGNFLMATAESKALGLVAGNNSSLDGIFTIGTGNTYTFDPNNRAVSGAYDYIGVAEHEFSEIMGRIPSLGYNSGYAPFDLFRFTAPGVRSFDPNATGVYFSTDNGVTVAKNYNAPGNGGDIQDWASGSPDSYNAFASSGVKDGLSATDVTVMNTLGWQASVGVPFDFNPAEGVALGVPLFIGGRILKKRLARKSTASKATVAVS